MQQLQLDPIYTVLLQLAAALLLAVGTWATARFTRWLGLKNSAQITVALDSALQRSVTYGLQQTQDLIREKGWDSPLVRTNALSAALPYMTERFADTLKLAGVDMGKPDEITAMVHGALDRAFPSAALIAAASPTTPPPTAPNPPTSAQLPPLSQTKTTNEKLEPLGR